MTKEKFLIYQDTDSCYLTLEKFVALICPGETDKQKITDALDKFVEEKIQPLIDGYYEQEANYFNAKNTMVMKRESIAPIGFWKDVKKHYAVNVLDEENVRYDIPELKIKGIAVVKTSTPKVCRKALREFIKLMLSFDDPYNKDNIASMEKYVSDFKQLFMQQEVEDISSPSSISELKTGKGMGATHKGAAIYNKYIAENGLIEIGYEPIQADSKIRWFYMVDKNPYNSDTFAFIDKLPDEIKKWCDKEKMFEKQFLKTIDDIIKPLGLKVDIYGKKTKINKFFS